MKTIKFIFAVLILFSLFQIKIAIAQEINKNSRSGQNKNQTTDIDSLINTAKREDFNDDQYHGKTKFYKVIELINIIEKARDAGFSEDEIRKITIRDSYTSETIDAMEYIQKRMREKAEKDKKAAIILKKKYLTVQDVFSDFAELEPSQLRDFRDELLKYVE